MIDLKDLILNNWIWLAVLIVVGVLASLFFRRMSHLSIDQIAKLSICINVADILLSLVFRKQLLPSETIAFPALAQVFLWIQFAMAGIVSARIIDKICAPKPGGETDVDNLSVISPSIDTETVVGWKSISRNDWLWVLGTDACFIATFALLMSFRHLTFHP